MFCRRQRPRLLHTSFIVASQGNSQRACSATKAGNGFSESYLEILNPFIVVLYYIIFYFITCVGCRGPHSCARAFILSFSTVYFIKTSFFFFFPSVFVVGQNIFYFLITWTSPGPCGFSKMIDRNYFVIMPANTLSTLAYILSGLMNLSVSTLYKWTLTQSSSTISGSPLFLLLFPAVRDLIKSSVLL